MPLGRVYYSPKTRSKTNRHSSLRLAMPDPSRKLHIIMAASEAVPLAKTGGLADVCGALPHQLARRGHRCSLFLPAYHSISRSNLPITDTRLGFVVNMNGRPVACRILTTELPHSGVTIYLIDQPLYFDREGLYGDSSGDYRDNCERFCFFSRAVVEAIDRLQLPVDILHCHDWQTGLIPAYVATRTGVHGWYSHARTVMTIHNLAYQGRFWSADWPLTGLPAQYFNWQHLEFFGDLNLLKAGLVFSDRLTTVSPTYAQEIQTPQLGCGLEGVLSGRSDRLTGIVNGVDYRDWDPFRDPHLPQPFSVDSWHSGKAAARTQLRQELGLAESSQPLIGLIGRLADQKGWDLVLPVLHRWLSGAQAQWVILGSGERRYQDLLLEQAKQWPGKLAVRIEFSEPLAHRIEAAADMFLMPSRYEPCGLNQLYSLRYGTVPIVHATGGLVDTVTDATPDALAQGQATGFRFDVYDATNLDQTLRRAVQMWYDAPHHWRQLVETGMRQDWSWGQSAARYEEVYRQAMAVPPVTAGD